MLKAIGNHPQRKRLCVLYRFLTRTSVSKNARQVRRLRDVATIIFKLDFNS